MAQRAPRAKKKNGSKERFTEFALSAVLCLKYLKQIRQTPLKCLRLVIMRIRFRACDFCRVAKNRSRSCKSKQTSCAEIELGSFIFLLVRLSSKVFGLRKNKPTSTTAISGCLAPRRVLFSPRGGPQGAGNVTSVVTTGAEAFQREFRGTSSESVRMMSLSALRGPGV